MKSRRTRKIWKTTATPMVSSAPRKRGRALLTALAAAGSFALRGLSYEGAASPALAVLPSRAAGWQEGFRHARGETRQLRAHAERRG